MKQSIDDILAEENFVHYAYHLRGVVNEAVEYLEAAGQDKLAERLDSATMWFADALAEWADRLPDVPIEEVEE